MGLAVRHFVQRLDAATPKRVESSSQAARVINPVGLDLQLIQLSTAPPKRSEIRDSIVVEDDVSVGNRFVAQLPLDSYLVDLFELGNLNIVVYRIIFGEDALVL